MFFLKRGLAAGLLASLIFSLKLYVETHYFKCYATMQACPLVMVPLAVALGICILFGMSLALLSPGLRRLYPRLPWLRLIVLVICGSYVYYELSMDFPTVGAEILPHFPRLNDMPFFMDAHYGPGTIFIPPTWPDFSYTGLYTLAGVLVNLYFGLFFLSGVRGRRLVKAAGPLLGVLCLTLFVFCVQRLLPPEPYMITQRWEAVTIVLGFPLLCAVSWGVLDLVAGHDRHPDRSEV